MSLKDLVELTSGEVQLKNGKAQVVFGLSPADIIALVDRHRDAAEKVFSDLTGDQAADVIGSPGSMAAKFFRDAPMLVADIIAVATGNPGEVEHACKLPTGLQIKLIEKVIEVTAHVDGGLGELLETVIAAVMAGSEVVKKLSNLPR